MRSYYFFLVLFLTLLSACAPKQNGLCPSITQSVELDQWVNEALIPYLAKRLGTYPRFKGQAVYLVGLEGDAIQTTELDGLTRSIRDRIKVRLHAVNGVNLAWNPGPVTTDVSGSLADLPLQKSEKVAYYIGIDIRQSAYDDTVSVQVRALDVTEQSWVDGFGVCWEGTLSGKQRRMFGQSDASSRITHSSSVADQQLSTVQTLPPQILTLPAAASIQTITSPDTVTLHTSITWEKIIDQFEIRVPNVSQLCNTTNPWIMGDRVLGPNEALANGNCIALTLTASAPSYLILLHQDEFGQLKTLENTRWSERGMIFPGFEFRFPASASGDVLQVEGYAGREWIHAITISDADLAVDIESMLSPGINAQTLLSLLAELQTTHGQSLDYQSISFLHL